jgi:hypothetical protein
MKRILLLGAAVATLGLTACGSDSTTSTAPSDPNCKASPWANNKIPPCTIPVNFVVDDSANKVFKDGEAQWKGQFAYDVVTRVSFNDGNWGGPFAGLYDDGPWSGYTVASGNTITTKYGHEPQGSVAGDHILGTTVFVYPPAAGGNSMTYSYGLIDHAFGDGWIWQGPNGSFTVAAGATAPINATGLTLAPFGTTDLRLHLTASGIAPNTCTGTGCVPTPWDYSGGIKVKGSAWGWVEVATTNVGGVYSFTLSDVAGAGKQLYHTGLTKTGDTPAFVFVFYAADGVTSKEYKIGTAGPPTAGVTAETKPAAGAWTAATVVKQATGDLNTYITVP